MLANLTISPRSPVRRLRLVALLLLPMLLGAVGCGQGAYEKKLQASVSRIETEFLDPTKADPNAAAAAGQPAAGQPAAGAAKPAPQGTGLSPAGQAIVAPLDLQ